MVTNPYRTNASGGALAESIDRPKINLSAVNEANGFTPRVQVLKRMVLDSPSCVASDRAWYVLESDRQTIGEHPCKRRAKAMANVLEKMPIAIRDNELIVGAPTPFVRGAHPYVEWDPIQLELVLQAERMTTVSEVTEAVLTVEDREKLLKACAYWKEHWPGQRIYDVCQEHFGETGKAITESRLNMVLYQGWGGYLCPGADYDKILAIGCNGIIAEAEAHIERIRDKASRDYTREDYEKVEFLESEIIVLNAIITFARRHAALAREKVATESDSQRKKELERIAETCENVPANGARNFYEAVQSYWFIPVVQDIEKAAQNSFAGRFDQYMFPYYHKDISEGRMTHQEVAELLGCLFMKWASLDAFVFNGVDGKRDHQKVAQANYFVNVTVGGITANGQDASNELGCMVLHVAKQVKTHQPHISLRYHRGMAPELLQKALECTRDHAGGIPAWFNDRLGTEYLLERGCSLEDARDWAVAGCINTMHPKSAAYQRPFGAGLVNHPKLFEMTLNNGVDPWTGAPLGPATGDPRTFNTFDELLNAYKAQVKHYYDIYVQLEKKFRQYQLEDGLYMPIISAFMQDCIKSGKDASRGGMRYYRELESGAFVDRGLTDVADSLTAIKKVIFDDKSATMDEVLDALKANFEGYEDLWKKLKDAPKFGNDDNYADSMAYDIWQWTKYQVLSYRDSEGRRFVVFRQGAAWAQWAGPRVGALPNGRKAYTNLADASASPVQGCDVKGPTATMNSVAKLDPGHMEGPLLNLKFSPGALKSREGMRKLGELIGSYMDKGGFHVQINVLDADMLHDARAHPENYRDLVVRLAGHSAFWVDLSPEAQDDIISRTEHQL